MRDRAQLIIDNGLVLDPLIATLRVRGDCRANELEFGWDEQPRKMDDPALGLLRSIHHC